MTHNSKKHLLRCLPPLLQSPLKPHILVVNSSSSDGTVEMARHLGAEVLIVKRKDFNHGLTREIARGHLKTDIVAMLTPDAYFTDELAFGKLIEPILQGQASAAYARQIPHAGADFFESFPRLFNYPKESHIRSLKDSAHYGVYTFFCSNSCAAYSSSALDQIGGFSNVLLGEDSVAVAKLLHKGHKVAYVAESLVHHSHRYSLVQEFQRSFDTGLARGEYASLLSAPTGDCARGFSYAKTMLEDLFEQDPIKLPYGLAHLFIKWFGYWIGKRSQKAPFWFKKKLSSQDFYWEKDPSVPMG